MTEQQQQGVSTSMHTQNAVFICHSSSDLQLATALCHELENAGRECWIAPRDVVSGETYPGQLVRAISTCDAFLLLVTHNSATSPHVLREVEQASRQNCSILPVVVDGACSDDLRYFIDTLHQISGTESEVVDSVTHYFAAPLVTGKAETASKKRSGPSDPLNVGVIPFPPFSTHGPHPSPVSGFYVELLERYAAEIGRPINFKPITNDRTICGLESGEFDVIASLYRSPRRTGRFLFAACFYASTITAVTRRHDMTVRTQRDLKRDDVRIAVCKGEVGAELAQDQYNATRGTNRLIEIDSTDVRAISAMVLANMADVAITDTVTCQHITEQAGGLLEEIFIPKPLFVGHIGLVLAPDSADLAKNLESDLSRLRESTDMQELETLMLSEYPDLIELL